MRTSADTLIVGAGPAGLSAALALSARHSTNKVVILELGHSYQQRFCPVDHDSICKGCGGVCNVISGFGGSMHYGDGIKLSRFPSGRRLAEHIGSEAKSLEDEAVGFLTDAVPITFELPLPSELPFELRNYPVAVISAYELQLIIQSMHASLMSRPETEIHFGTTVLRINPKHSEFEVIARGRGGNERCYHCRNLIIAVGRAGFLWWRSELRRLRLDHTPPHISLGLRFECSADYLRNAAATHPDFKTTIRLNGTKVKTFCFCAESKVGGGRVKFTRYGNFTLLDGHVISEATPSANFGLLIQLTDSEGKPRSYDWVAENILKPYKKLRTDHSGKPVVQWYPDFRDSQLRLNSLSEIRARIGFRPSVSDVEVADLSSLVGENRYAFCTVFEQLFSTLTDMGGIAHDASNAKALVYGLEIESVWDRLELARNFETSTIPGLFVIGDCAGIAQGILQSMVSGIAAARALVK